MVRPYRRAFSVCAAGAASWHAETNFDAIDKNKGQGLAVLVQCRYRPRLSLAGFGVRLV
jgi:hypothetical protein